MPGARKGSFAAGTAKRAPSAKKISRSAPAPTIAKSGKRPQGGGGHNSRRALLEGKVGLLLKLVKRKESAENWIRLGELYISLEQWGKAKEALEASLKLEPADALGARRVLVPLLLNLGEHEDAAALLEKWRSDESAVMLCSRLLCLLAVWDGEDATEPPCTAAWDAIFSCNWQAW